MLIVEDCEFCEHGAPEIRPRKRVQKAGAMRHIHTRSWTTWRPIPPPTMSNGLTPAHRVPSRSKW